MRRIALALTLFLAAPVAAQDVSALNTVCRDLRESRDPGIVPAAEAAHVAILEAAVRGDWPLPPDVGVAHAAALTAHIDEMRRVTARLADMAPADPALAPAWRSFMAEGAALILRDQARLALLSRPQITGGDALAPQTGEGYDWATALGLANRDCAFVWHHPGTPPADAAFVTAAARACSASVERRLATGYAAISDRALAAFIAALAGHDMPKDAAAANAAMAAEWAATARDMAAVPDAPQGWHDASAAATALSAHYAARATATEPGAIAAAYDRSAMPAGGPDLTALLLDRTDCAALRW